MRRKNRMFFSALMSAVLCFASAFFIFEGGGRQAQAATCPDPLPEPSNDRNVLIRLYCNTGGSGWSKDDKWLSNDPINDWHGVIADPSERATGLELGGNNLSGTIPTELGNLTSLRVLWLHQNQLSGTIPAELGDMTRLIWLRLDGNQLSGTIPTELGDMTGLRNLNLSKNKLSGTIPTNLSSLTDLTQLYLIRNQLSGTIPTELGNLTRLGQLWVSGNRISGTIPTNLDSLTQLNRLWLDGNQLSGTIPTNLGGLASMWELVISDNQLSGTIPTNLGSLTRLNRLRLSGNQLSGTIPTELGNLASVFDLFLSNNQLSGTIPTQLGSMTSLQHLFLHNNQLSGAIPSELGNLTLLGHLNLSNNPSLSGTLPVRLSDIEFLASLDIRCTAISTPEDMDFQNWLNGISFRSECPPPPVIEAAEGVRHSGDAENGFSLTPEGEGGRIVYGDRTINLSVTRDEGLSSDANPAVIVSSNIIDQVERITFMLSEVSPEVPPSGFRLAGFTAEIDLVGVTLGEGDTVTVCLPQAEGEEESDIYHYNEMSEEWERLESNPKTVNEDKMVCAETDAFSLFAVFVAGKEETVPPPSPSAEGSGCAIAAAGGEAASGRPENAVFNLLLIISVLLLIPGRKLRWR